MSESAIASVGDHGALVFAYSKILLRFGSIGI